MNCFTKALGFQKCYRVPFLLLPDMIRSFVILSIRSIFCLCFYMLSLLYLLQNCPRWRQNSWTCLWWGQKETNCSSDKTWILTQVSLHRVLLQEVNKQIIWQRYCPGDSFKYVINMSENPVCFNTLVFSTNQALQSPENSTDLWLIPSTLLWCWMDCQKSVGKTN